MPNARPTVYDVAELAGVSIATVSFAFRKPDRVAEKTRAAVLHAARELGYLPSGSARGLARGRTGVLGLHLFDRAMDGTTRPPMPDAFPIFDDEVQHGFISECRAQGVGALLSSGGPALAEVVDTAGRVDGLAVLPTTTAMETLAAVGATIPVVLISTRAGAGHHVTVDNDAGVRMLVDHLVHEHGATSIGWLGPEDMDDFAERHDAFTRAAGTLLDVSGVQTLDTEPVTSATRFSTVLARAREGSLPDAILCASDIHAIALIDDLRSAGVMVPRDVRVVGFDGLMASRLASPSLTTVRQPMQLIGSTAARLLLMDPEERASHPQTVRLPVTLQIGQSCGCEVVPSE